MQERERTRSTSTTSSAGKAPPTQVRGPISGQPPIQDQINRMSLQELQALVQREDERMAKNKGGYYVSTPIATLQLYRDRIVILETQRQEEDRLERARGQEQL
eukprot:3796744-Amphidinium_carterae.1